MFSAIDAMLTGTLILPNLIAFDYMAVAGIGLTTSTLFYSAVCVDFGVYFACPDLSASLQVSNFKSPDGFPSINAVVEQYDMGVDALSFALIVPLLMRKGVR